MEMLCVSVCVFIGARQGAGASQRRASVQSSYLCQGTAYFLPLHHRCLRESERQDDCVHAENTMNREIAMDRERERERDTNKTLRSKKDHK